MEVAPLRRSGAGLYVPIRDWLLYADHGLASMCRSRGGSIVPIIGGSIVAVSDTPWLESNSGHQGSTLNPDFRAFSESDSSSGAGLKAMIAKVLWWHVCNSHRQT
ncbi:hypothetical protein AAG895_17930 [Thauera sp. JM12B12]|uniref:hypothetical protein n=1 Tax=Thauera sp. JM12B12 TaxID=3142262 RepID=UPI0031F4317E